METKRHRLLPFLFAYAHSRIINFYECAYILYAEQNKNAPKRVTDHGIRKKKKRGGRQKKEKS